MYLKIENNKKSFGYCTFSYRALFLPSYWNLVLLEWDMKLYKV